MSVASSAVMRGSVSFVLVCLAIGIALVVCCVYCVRWVRNRTPVHTFSNPTYAHTSRNSINYWRNAETHTLCLYGVSADVLSDGIPKMYTPRNKPVQVIVNGWSAGVFVNGARTDDARTDDQV